MSEGAPPSGRRPDRNSEVYDKTTVHRVCQVEIVESLSGGRSQGPLLLLYHLPEHRGLAVRGYET